MSRMKQVRVCLVMAKVTLRVRFPRSHSVWDAGHGKLSQVRFLKDALSSVHDEWTVHTQYQLPCKGKDLDGRT